MTKVSVPGSCKHLVSAARVIYSRRRVYFDEWLSEVVEVWPLGSQSGRKQMVTVSRSDVILSVLSQHLQNVLSFVVDDDRSTPAVLGDGKEQPPFIQFHLIEKISPLRHLVKNVNLFQRSRFWGRSSSYFAD